MMDQRIKEMCKNLYKAVLPEYRKWWEENVGGGILIAELMKIISYDGRSCVVLEPEEIEEICSEIE